MCTMCIFLKYHCCLSIENHIQLHVPFQELEDSFNYGLFQPPLNGRAGETKMLMLSMLLIMLMLMSLKLLMLLVSFMQ